MIELGFNWNRIDTFDTSEEPTHVSNVHNINRNDHIAVWGNVNDATFVNFTYNSSSEEVVILILLKLWSINLHCIIFHFFWMKKF